MSRHGQESSQLPLASIASLVSGYAMGVSAYLSIAPDFPAYVHATFLAAWLGLYYCLGRRRLNAAWVIGLGVLGTAPWLLGPDVAAAIILALGLVATPSAIRRSVGERSLAYYGVACGSVLGSVLLISTAVGAVPLMPRLLGTALLVYCAGLAVAAYSAGNRQAWPEAAAFLILTVSLVVLVLGPSSAFPNGAGQVALCLLAPAWLALGSRTQRAGGKPRTPLTVS